MGNATAFYKGADWYDAGVAQRRQEEADAFAREQQAQQRLGWQQQADFRSKLAEQAAGFSTDAPEIDAAALVRKYGVGNNSEPVVLPQPGGAQDSQADYNQRQGFQIAAQGVAPVAAADQAATGLPTQARMSSTIASQGLGGVVAGSVGPTPERDYKAQQRKMLKDKAELAALQGGPEGARQLQDAQQSLMTLNIQSASAEIASKVMSLSPEQSAQLAERFTSDSGINFDLEYDPKTKLTSFKHGSTSSKLTQAQLSKYMAASYRLDNGDATALADMEAIDTKLAAASKAAFDSKHTVMSGNNAAVVAGHAMDNQDKKLVIDSGTAASNNQLHGAMADFYRQRADGSFPSKLTASQQRSNLEIDDAREQVAGLTPAEIRSRTAKTTDTGRENPDYDPSLARAASLANRRKLGNDPHFDMRRTESAPQTPAQPAPGQGVDRQEVAKRFRSDPKMNVYRLGKDTPQGTEVLTGTGQIVGHYR